MKHILSNERREYDLFEDDEGVFMFIVLCGSIGLYEARIKLSHEEASRFRSEGESFLNELATDMRKNESGFRERFI